MQDKVGKQSSSSPSSPDLTRVCDKGLYSGSSNEKLDYGMSEEGLFLDLLL